MNQHKTEINKASKAIASLENFHRFCSNFLATAAEGFKQPILFTNEEAQDWVFRTGTAWPGPTSIPPATAGAEQPGVVVAHDVKNGKTKPIYGMGRFNHENSRRDPRLRRARGALRRRHVPDESAPASSQLYMYTAADSDELWDDAGTLHAFVADEPPTADNDYFDLQPGETINGNFLPVPEQIAKGKAADGHELTRAVDFPNYPPPAGGPSLPPDGPQWVLDQWGNVNPANTPNVGDVPATTTTSSTSSASRTSRTTRTDTSNVVYLADSGRAEPPVPQTR